MCAFFPLRQMNLMALSTVLQLLYLDLINQIHSFIISGNKERVFSNIRIAVVLRLHCAKAKDSVIAVVNSNSRSQIAYTLDWHRRRYCNESCVSSVGNLSGDSVDAVESSHKRKIVENEKNDLFHSFRIISLKSIPPR